MKLLTSSASPANCLLLECCTAVFGEESHKIRAMQLRAVDTKLVVLQHNTAQQGVD